MIAVIAKIDRRLLLAALVTLFVAFSFWFGSRIPNLDEKAMMGGDSQIESLGFNVVFEVRQSDPAYQRVLFTTVNWIDTNKRGMTFGVILAACLMTVLSLFRRKSFRNGFANAAMGVVIGAPLGVCVNCAAPIAKALHSAGTRLETTLATMMSSPTMNIIVLTMLISMFPWYMVATKLAITLGLIIIGIPILCRLLPVSLTASPDQVCELPTGRGLALDAGLAPAGGWVGSARWLVQTLASHLWYIVRTTVPLMLLAGFLGSLLIVLLPWETIAQSLPKAGSTLTTTIMYMGGLAVIGTFLPVPIAFDVIVVAVLMASGMPVKFAMVLLFTLGIFSIYSAQIVWTSISRLMAVVLFGFIMACGFGAGVVAHHLSVWEEANQREVMYRAFLRTSEPAPRPLAATDPGVDDARLVLELRQAALTPTSVQTAGPDGIEVARYPLRTRTAAAGPMFAKVKGERLGITESSQFSPLRQLAPQYWGRAIATGDVHNDGWPDVLIVSDNLAFNGLSLYANRNGESFVKQRVDIPRLRELIIVSVGLVDIDGDGWLDIFLSAYKGGNHVIYNQEGRFLSQNMIALPGNAPVSPAVTFGDIDEDGDLDLVLGNWSLGFLRGVVSGEPVTSRNAVIRQNKGRFELTPLSGFPGETLSTLLTDFNDDGHLDLIVGNDFTTSDIYYTGDGSGAFSQITPEAKVIPHTTKTTMSVASADIDNDLRPELYVAQISRGEGANFSRQAIPARDVCHDLEDRAAVQKCMWERDLHAQMYDTRMKSDAAQCLAIEDAVVRQECMAIQVVLAAWKLEDPDLCALLAERMARLHEVCNDIFSEHVQPTRAQLKDEIYQMDRHNVMLVPNANAGFDDRAVDLGLAVTGWSWNAKFADVDNDEWQDLYVANGLYYSGRRESNFFFANQKGEGFVERTAESGLTEYRATGSYSYVDFDGDGDLDIFSVPVIGSVHVFVNNSATGNSIVFELRDGRGNSFGVGAKVVIRYGPGAERAQMREIQAGGGFLSFDPPLAHFGLGEHQQVEEVEVRWSTGETTVVRGPFPANSRYVLRRPGRG